MSGSAANYKQAVDVFISRHLSPQARAAHLARVARSGVQDLVASHRAGPEYTKWVDGREDAAEESVQAEGTIVYRWRYVGEAVAFALEFLQKRSPPPSTHSPTSRLLYTTAYRDSFYLGLDGRFVLAKAFNPDRINDVAEVVIGNVQPYSRMVDVQRRGKLPIRFAVPAGLFDDAVKAIRQRFGNLVSAKRVYTMQFPGQYILKGHGKRGRRGKPVESPAIIIKPFE